MDEDRALATGLYSEVDVLPLEVELSLGAGVSLLAEAWGGASCWTWLELVGAWGGPPLCHRGRQSLSNFHICLCPDLCKQGYALVSAHADEMKDGESQTASC